MPAIPARLAGDKEPGQQPGSAPGHSLTPTPWDGVLHPSASVSFSFPPPPQESRQNSPSKGGLQSLVPVRFQGCGPPDWEELIPSLKLPLLNSMWEKMGRVGES